MNKQNAAFKLDCPPSSLPVAVIGAGFTGTVTALNLLRWLPTDDHVLLCERSSKFACGIAYGSDEGDHLLNVRAANMSAFADQPDGFSKWLRGCAPEDARGVRVTPAGVFAARWLYGRYLNAMLGAGLTGNAGDTRLALVADEVVDLTPAPGGGWHLIFACGAQERVRAVILAIGNFKSSQSAGDMYRSDPWTAGALQDLKTGDAALVIGTGLTAMDIVVSLNAKGFPGPVIAVSRRGLLPHRHASSAPWPKPVFSAAERVSILALLRRIRREIAVARAQGADWRGVIDSIRHDTQDLWRGLPQRERSRFLRHLRPFWDVHRHRMAPPIADQIDALRTTGYLRIIQGRFCGIRKSGRKNAEHALVQRRGADPEPLAAQRVINATGVASGSRCDDRLLNALLARGTVRLDPHGLGIDVTDTLQAIDADGCASSTMWALGPAVRGVFWECSAVPDIRVQAARLAMALAG